MVCVHSFLPARAIYRLLEIPFFFFRERNVVYSSVRILAEIVKNWMKTVLYLLVVSDGVTPSWYVRLGHTKGIQSLEQKMTVGEENRKKVLGLHEPRELDGQ